MRILAVDYGDRRVGLALSDELGIAAHGLPTARVRSMEQAVEVIVRTAAEHGVERVVVGLPLNMDGTTGPRAEATTEFCRRCRDAFSRREMNVPVETFDERLTTMRARSALHEMGFEERKQKDHVDRVSAIFLLQDYLQAAAARKG